MKTRIVFFVLLAFAAGFSACLVLNQALTLNFEKPGQNESFFDCNREVSRLKIKLANSAYQIRELEKELKELTVFFESFEKRQGEKIKNDSRLMAELYRFKAKYKQELSKYRARNYPVDLLAAIAVILEKNNTPGP